jgi:STE24 endopeptidase
MNPERIEKIFWCLVIVWFLLRSSLLSCQYIGNTDPGFKQEVLKYFSETDIETGKAYALNGFLFKALYGAFYIFTLIILLCLGFFNSIWQKTVKLVGEGLFRSDLLFPFVFLFILSLLSFPSSLYFGYFKETASGFSNITSGSWFWYYFKAIALNIFLQGIFMWVVISIIHYFPTKWPWLLPLICSALVACSICIAPFIITPIFYNEKPLEKGEFRDKLFEIAKKAELSVNEIYVIDESRYSKHTNAYFSGFGSFRRIVLYDNLLTNHTPDEALMIFAHEAGHWKYSHMRWGLCCGLVGAFLVCFFVYWIFDYIAVVKWFGLYRIDSSSVIPFFMISYLILQLIFAPIESQISQFMEKQADLTSIELTGKNDVFKKAQIRLAKDNKSDLLPHPFRVFWLYSHPIAIDRIHFAD